MGVCVITCVRASEREREREVLLTIRGTHNRAAVAKYPKDGANEAQTKH